MEAGARAGEGPNRCALWASDLEQRLYRFARAYQEYRDSLHAVRALVPQTCSGKEIKLFCSIQEIIYTWMDEKCEEATNESGSTGHVEILKSDLPSELGQFDLRYSSSWTNEDYGSLTEAPVSLVVEHAFDLVDVEAFYEAVMEMAGNLQVEAYRDSAMRLGDSFGLVSRVDWKRSKALRVKCVRGLFVLERGSYGTSSQRADRISSLEAVAQTFEDEAGVYGLVEILCKSRQVLEQAQHAAKVPSRMRISTKTRVEAVFYKDKMTFHFPESLFEALVGFVQEYAPTDYLCPLERD